MTFANSYFVGRILGQGAHSTVHHATDAEGREWVLKLLKPGPVAEKEWGLELPEHPALLRPVAKGRTKEGPWLAFPYCPRGDLGERLKKEGRLSVAAVTFLLSDMRKALEALHARGLVHRDLSPGNLLFDAGSNVRLADFGCVLEKGRVPDIPVDGLGTPTHADPRQLMGGAADPRSDLYALGSICYEGLAGSPPFAADAPERLAARKLKERPRPLAEVASEVPAALAAEVEALLNIHGR